VQVRRCANASPFYAVANRTYYEILSARDIGRMERFWAQTENDVNIAPPTRLAAHVGWAEIKKTYETFWATLDELSVSMERPTIVVRGEVAWVYGIERTRRRTKGGPEASGRNLGSSIFIKRGSAWRLIFHEAAPIPP
jgi:ketosteroid isomerase-like protein